MLLQGDWDSIKKDDFKSDDSRKDLLIPLDSVKLADFGFSVLFREGGTHGHSYVGTQIYLPPVSENFFNFDNKANRTILIFEI